VIVYSSLPTAQPDFHKIANADLDGDKFWVCYDEELVRQVKEVNPAP
jgi:hypothetical protein